jgi:hypothetical protein
MTYYKRLTKWDEHPSYHLIRFIGKPPFTVCFRISPSDLFAEAKMAEALDGLGNVVPYLVAFQI